MLGLVGRVVGIVLVLAVLAEIGLRVLGSAPGSEAEAAREAHPEGGSFVPHPFKGYALRPTPGSPDRNSQGLRGREVVPEKPPGVVRILCLGGATTYGSGLPLDEAWPARLGALLAPLAPAGGRYEVLNCGVPGYSTVESLIDLELRLLELQPDALVVQHGFDDARAIQARGFRADYSHLRSSWREPTMSGPERWLWKHSRAWARVARAAGFGPRSARLEDLVYVEDHADLYVPVDEGGVNAAGVETFIRNIDSTVGLAKARGLELLLATFPTRAGDAGDGEDFAPTVAALNRRLVEYAREQGVPLADVAAALDGRPELFTEPGELDAQGAEAQAELVLTAAREAGLWGLAR